MRTYDEKVVQISGDYLVIYDPGGKGEYAHIVVETVGADNSAGDVVVADFIVYYTGTSPIKVVFLYLSEDFDLNEFYYGHIDGFPDKDGIAVKFSYTASSKKIRIRRLFGSGALIGIAGDTLVSGALEVDVLVLSGEGIGGTHFAHKGRSYFLWSGGKEAPYLKLYHEYSDTSSYKAHGSFTLVGGGGMIIAGASDGWLSLVPIPVKDYAVRAANDEEGFTIFFDSANSNSGGALRWYDLNEGGRLAAYIAFNENMIMYVAARNGWQLYFGGVDSVPPGGSFQPSVDISPSQAVFQLDVISTGVVKGAFRSTNNNDGITQNVVINDGDGTTVHHLIFENGILVDYYTS